MYWSGGMKTSFGNIAVVVSEKGVVAIGLGEEEVAFREQISAQLRAEVQSDPVKVQPVLDEIADYLRGEKHTIDTPLDSRLLTTFQKQVLLRLRDIPRGQVTTYGELARTIGRSGAARAVGRALGANPLPLALPCHRVVASNGALGGFSSPGGVEEKARLLKLEGVNIEVL